MARLIVPLMFALLAVLEGCSCCHAPPSQTFTYIVDDATATRVSGGRPSDGAHDQLACRRECDALAGTDPGPADARLPDAGAARPSLPALNCALGPSGASWLLTCYYAAPCPA